MEVLYSEKLREMFDTCIIDGVCIKRKNDKFNDNKDILLQRKEIIRIYCSKEKYEEFINLTHLNDFVSEKYEEGFIKIYYKEVKDKKVRLKIGNIKYK